MEVIRKIAEIFARLSEWAIDARDYCRGIPLLGGGLVAFFEVAWELFFDLSRDFYDFANTMSGLTSTIEDRPTWDKIKALIDVTWGFLADIHSTIWYDTRDLIKTEYSEVTDFWGNAYQAAENLVTDKYSYIKDFWVNIRIGIKDWAETDLLQWLEDRAEKVVEVAGKILDKVW